MKRVIAVLLLSATTVQAADFWSGLWLTPDQRGERLLRQGDAAAAARTFSELRRRAYAELLAGDYAAAARDFAGFDDSDGHYNRGNALGRGGDLQAALQAYDTALARNPRNQDARRNRDLVARALQQPPPPPSGSRQSPQPSPPAPAQQGAAGQRGDGQGGKREGNENQAKPGHGSDQRQGDASGPEGQAAQRGANQAGRGASPMATPAPGAAADVAPDSAAAARRDAAAALARPAPGDHAAAGRRPEPPSSEQQLAREQWLQRIPDDPGGLLRRKFMIEHLLRQQGIQP